MEVNNWQRNRIYGYPRVETIKNRIEFISTKRRKNWFTIQTKILDNSCKNNSTIHNPQPNKQTSDATSSHQMLQMPKMSSHCKTKSMELIDMKTKRYYQCKQNSQRLLKKIQLQRLKDISTKKIKRIKVLFGHQRARENLSKYQQVKLVELKQENMKKYVQDALILKTVEIKQNLMKQQEQQLKSYENELSYRSAVMRKIKEMINKGNQN